MASSIVATEPVQTAFDGFVQVFQMFLGSNPYTEHYYAYYDSKNRAIYLENKHGEFFKSSNEKLKLKEVFEFFRIKREVIGVELASLVKEPLCLRPGVDTMEQEVLRFQTSQIILK
jgi:hypothetical protein